MGHLIGSGRLLPQQNISAREINDVLALVSRQRHNDAERLSILMRALVALAKFLGITEYSMHQEMAKLYAEDMALERLPGRLS